MSRRSHARRRGRHGARRRGMRVLLLALAVTALAGPGVAHATRHVMSFDGGAVVYADLWRASNGGLYAWVDVHDIAADGRCAHGTLAWYHENGNVYRDNGMWVCGYGNSAVFKTPVRNWTLYREVDLGAFTDGQSYPNYTRLAWFDSTIHFDPDQNY